MRTRKRFIGALTALTLAALATVAVVGLPAVTAAAGSMPFVSTSGRAQFTCGVNVRAYAWCWGRNDEGELGNNSTVDSTVPVLVSGLSSGVTAIATGSTHACALISPSAVECWGDNTRGELGDGTTTSHLAPVAVPGLSAAQISAGSQFTCAVNPLNTVKCWGSNKYGQLGNGTGTDSPTPVAVPSLKGQVAQVSAGGGHACALLTNSTVQCWGLNATGDLGNGTTTSSPTPVPVTGLEGVKAISAGSDDTCALLTNGGVTCWGENHNGTLGDGSNTNRLTPVPVSGLSSGVTAIATGDTETCALNYLGAVLCWGDASFGEVGNGVFQARFNTPQQVFGLVASPAGGGGGAIQIAAGSRHACAVTPAGQVECWGQNGRGQLGDGTTLDRAIPGPVIGLTTGIQDVEVGTWHACALTAGLSAVCWGQYTGDGTFQDRLTPVGVGNLPHAVARIAVGQAHGCALSAAGEERCWGWNKFGQVGDGSTTDRKSPVGVSGFAADVLGVAAGWDHTCAITTTGAKCWGMDSVGELGNGTTGTDSPTPVDVTTPPNPIAQLSTQAADSTCAVDLNARAWCWGDNVEGELGDGTTTNHSTPVPVSGLAGEAVAVSVGSGFACALLTRGGVQCWGANAVGQLGDGTRRAASRRPSCPD